VESDFAWSSRRAEHSPDDPHVQASPEEAEQPSGAGLLEGAVLDGFQQSHVFNMYLPSATYGGLIINEVSK